MEDTKNSVTNNLCDARMQNINDNLSNMADNIKKIEQHIEQITKLQEELPIISLRLQSLEKWRENFSFPKILGVMALIAGSVTTIYEFVRKLVMK
jgi:DNA replication protein DnaD